MNYIDKPSKAQIVKEAEREDGCVEYLAECAGEWRVSKTPADSFSRFGTGPTHYRIPERQEV